MLCCLQVTFDKIETPLIKLSNVLGNLPQMLPRTADFYNQTLLFGTKYFETKIGWMGFQNQKLCVCSFQDPQHFIFGGELILR